MLPEHNVSKDIVKASVLYLPENPALYYIQKGDHFPAQASGIPHPVSKKLSSINTAKCSQAKTMSPEKDETTENILTGDRIQISLILYSLTSLL